MNSTSNNLQTLTSRPTEQIANRFETKIEELNASVGILIEDSETQKALIAQLEEQLKNARGSFKEIEAQIETTNDKIFNLRENQDIFVQGAELKAQLAQLRLQLPETLWAEFDQIEVIEEEEDIDNFGADESEKEIETDTELTAVETDTEPAETKQQPAEVKVETNTKLAEAESPQLVLTATSAKYFPERAESEKLATLMEQELASLGLKIELAETYPPGKFKIGNEEYLASFAVRNDDGYIGNIIITYTNELACDSGIEIWFNNKEISFWDWTDSLENKLSKATDDNAADTQEAEIEATNPQPEAAKWELIKVSDRISYFSEPNGVIGRCYAGFSNKKIAESWGRYLTTQNIADGFEVRKAQRIKNYKHEIKIWGIKGIAEIEKLAASDLTIPPKTKSYRSAKEDAGNDGSYDIGEFVAITDDYWGIYHFGNAERAKEVGRKLFDLAQTDFRVDKVNGDLMLPTPTLEDGEDWQRQIQALLVEDAREALPVDDGSYITNEPQPTDKQPANVAASDDEVK